MSSTSVDAGSKPAFRRRDARLFCHDRGSADACLSTLSRMRSASALFPRAGRPSRRSVAGKLAHLDGATLAVLGARSEDDRRGSQGLERREREPHAALRQSTVAMVLVGRQLELTGHVLDRVAV